MAGSAGETLRDEQDAARSTEAEFAPLPTPETPAEAPPGDHTSVLDSLRELEQMHAQLLTVTVDYRLTLESVLRAASHLAGTGHGLLFAPEEGDLEVVHSIGFPEGAEPPDGLRAQVAEAWRTRRPAWRALDAESRSWGIAVPVAFPPRAQAPYIPERRRISIARIPHGEPMALLYLDRVPAASEEIADRVARLGHFAAGCLSTVLLNARWLNQATTDRLSGLLTRDRFSLALEDLFEQAQSDRLPVTVLLVDITGLREINAAFGRARGDELIARVARALRRLSRRSDVLARYGGDDFAIALPNTDTAEALQVADRIRRTAPSIPTSRQTDEARSRDHRERCLLTRLAIGIASYPAHGRSAWEVLLHADQALHSAARRGNSCVEIWTPGESGGNPRADRLAGVMTGHFADDATNVRSLLELMHGLLTEATPQDVWQRFTDGVTEAADAVRGVLFRADAAGTVVEEAWASPEGCGSGAPPLMEDRDLEAARTLSALALRSGRPERANESVAPCAGPGAATAGRCRIAFPVPLQGAVRTVLHLEAPGATRFATEAGVEQIAAFIGWIRPALERVVGSTP